MLPTQPQSAGTLDPATGQISPDLPGKFIYLVRNGKDVANSFHNHLSHQALSDGGFEGSYAEFVEKWTAGKVDFGERRRALLDFHPRPLCRCHTMSERCWARVSPIVRQLAGPSAVLA